MPDLRLSPTTTVVFTDIEGHTSMMQRLGDARGRELLRTHEGIVRAALRRYSGHEVKTMGDGFMASFGSAHSALVCAIALQRNFDAYNATAEVPIHVRVGVNAGEPIAERADLFGQSVISASRIAGLAAGGEILVSLVVHELVAGKGFLFADRGLSVLRGMEDPVRVFELHWRGDDAVPPEYADATGAWGGDQVSGRARWLGSRGVLVGIGAVAVSGAVAAGLFLLTRDSDPAASRPGGDEGASPASTTVTEVAGAATPGNLATGAAQPGELAFVSKGDGVPTIWAVQPDGTRLRPLARVSEYDSDFAWSPDGQRAVFTSRVDGIREIYVMNPDGSGLVRLTEPAAENNEAVWSPDGTRIAFTSRRDGNKEIYVMNSDGTSPSRLTNSPGDDMHPAWSPDGLQLAFSSSRDGNREIYTMAHDGSAVTRITNVASDDDQPAWSPDGLRIAFSSERDGNREIYVAGADGSGPIRLTNHPAEDFHAAWAPDGQRLAFTSERDAKDNREIYLMNQDGTGLTRLTNSPGEDDQAAWYPSSP